MSTSPAAQQHAATRRRPAAAARGHWLAKLALSCFTGGSASEQQQPEQSQQLHNAGCSSASLVCHGRATSYGRATASGQQQQQQRHSVQANGRMTHDFSCKVPEGDCEAVDAQYTSAGAAQAHVSTAASKADAAVKVSAVQGPHCKLTQAATPSPASLTNSDGSTNNISSGSSASDLSNNTASAALQIHAADPTAPPSGPGSELLLSSAWPRSTLLSAPAGATATLSEATPPVADPCNRDGFSAPIPTLHLAPAHKPLVQRRSAAIAVAMGSACPGSPRGLGRISYDCDSGAAARHHADRHEGSASPGHWPSHGHGHHGHHGHHGQCRTSTRTSRGREALPAAYQFAQLISDAGSAAAAAAGAGSIFGGAGAADGGVPRLWPGPALRVKPRATRGSSCPTEGACHGPASALALGGGSVGGVTSPVLGSAALAGATSPMFVSGPSPTWVLSSRVSRGPLDLGAALGLTALAATTPGHSPAHSSGLGSPFAGKGPVSGCGGVAAARAGSSSERRSANGGRPLVLTPQQSRGSGGGSSVAAPLMDCAAAGGGAHRLSASSSCSSLHQAARSKMLASAGTLAVPAGGRSSAVHGGRVYTTQGSTSLLRRGARGFGGLGPRSGSTGNLPLLAETHATHEAPGFPPRLARMHEASESSGSGATPRHSLSAGAHAAAWSYTRA